MKYIFTHNPTFQRRAIPITLLGGFLSAALFSNGMYLAGISVAVLSLVVVYLCQRFSQLRMVASQKGISFLRGRDHSFIEWEEVKKVQQLSAGLQLVLKEDRGYKVAIPADTNNGKHFAQFSDLIRNLCSVKHIEFSETGR